MIGPPTNSATMNCQPMSTKSTSPSSTTKLVAATMKTIEVMKLAPFLKSDFDIAEAAYEQLDDTIPYPAALIIASGRRVPNCCCIVSFEMKA